MGTPNRESSMTYDEELAEAHRLERVSRIRREEKTVYLDGWSQFFLFLCACGAVTYIVQTIRAEMAIRDLFGS